MKNEPEPSNTVSGTTSQQETVTVTSVVVKTGQSHLRSVGWNSGDQVIIKGNGFTRSNNRIYSTDGQSESFITEGESVDGTEIVIVLPEDFRAPFGTGLRVKNANGEGSNISPGHRVNF